MWFEMLEETQDKREETFNALGQLGSHFKYLQQPGLAKAEGRSL